MCIFIFFTFSFLFGAFSQIHFISFQDFLILTLTFTFNSHQCKVPYFHTHTLLAFVNCGHLASPLFALLHVSKCVIGGLQEPLHARRSEIATQSGQNKKGNKGRQHAKSTRKVGVAIFPELATGSRKRAQKQTVLILLSDRRTAPFSLISNTHFPHQF